MEGLKLENLSIPAQYFTIRNMALKSEFGLRKTHTHPTNRQLVALGNDVPRMPFVSDLFRAPH